MRRLILAPESVCGGSSQALAGPARPGHWLLDTGTMLMRLSPGFGEMLGTGHSASLPFRIFLEMIHPEDRGRVEALADVLAAEVSSSFNEAVRVFRPDGAVMRIVLKGEVETAPGGGIVSVFGMAEEVPGAEKGRDCPESDCAERERFRTYFEHSPEALFVVNLRAEDELVYQARNAAYVELSGLPPDADASGVLAEAVPERIAGSLVRHYDECIDLGAAVTREEIIELGDGLRIWSMTLAPVPSKDGGVLGIVRDVTEQRMLEASLRAARNAAESANRERSTLLAHASHVLRTPLNAVIGYSDMLMGGIMGPVGPGSVADAVTAINESGHQVLSLVEELIDLARLEDDASAALDEQSVDLDYILRDTWRTTAPAAAKRGTSLKIRIPPKTPNVWADEWAVRRVIQVLLSNAVKFTRRGEILVTVEASDKPSSSLSVVVRDSGVGIAAERLATILERFTLLDPVKAHGSGGMGIGLRLATRLMDRHGGRLSIDSQPGVGTTVRATFPGERVGTREYAKADLAER
jgi:signal transduction histidine kinase